MKTLLLIFPLLILLLTACNLPTTTRQNPVSQQKTQLPEIIKDATATPTTQPVVIATPSCPNVQSFGNLIGVSPEDLSLQPLNPQFTWYYSAQQFWNTESADPWAEICIPDSYELYFSTGPGFTNEFSVQVTNPTSTYPSNSSVLPLVWVISPALEPVKVYRWLPVGHYGMIDIGTSKIANLHDDSKWLPVSDQWQQGVFRTGPACASGSIDIPGLLIPAEGEAVYTRQPKLIWETTTCMPLRYQLQILSPQVGNLWFQVQTNYPWWSRYTTTGSIFPQLPDCSRIYWKVKGGVDTIGSQEWGEWSEVRSFYVNSGSCPTPTPTSALPTRTPTRTSTATPEPVGVDCGSIKDSMICDNHPACYWKKNLSNPSAGTCESNSL
ncbi:MAG: hypothetical protein C0401_06785 [Anaerolinea sp.]|nr:hypothetical protein [Anaerolinea sp.]